MDFRVGELYISDVNNLWEQPSNVTPSILVGHLKPGDLVIILEVRGRDTKVLSPRGDIGWIDGIGGTKKRLHSV